MYVCMYVCIKFYVCMYVCIYVCNVCNALHYIMYNYINTKSLYNLKIMLTKLMTNYSINVLSNNNPSYNNN